MARKGNKGNSFVRVLMMPIVAAVLCAGAAVWTGAIWVSYSQQKNVASGSKRKPMGERSRKRVKAQK